ncbi:porin [Vibrio vulnificus]|uniref:porin n=1 Tax=Vibrio vulnificus TaxID=672 RepID=UPI00293317A0|nr:porin [Vibrio vulnificus]EHK9043063.1 porin [Vibrio vulnificus]ELP6123115.1 porin [Vibrio vulnificus]ELR8744595.1 porin [Vibrio vulnificus]
MKKAALATAILSAVVTGSSFAATVYKTDGTELKIGGRVEFRGDFIGTDKGVEIDGTMEDSTRARLNVKGTTDLGNDLQAFGFYEAEQKTGESSFKNRYMYAGVKTNAGAFSVGKQDMASVIVSDLTDITEFSGVQQFIDASSDKTDSTLAYRGSFDALQIEATYSASDADNSDLMGISGLYSLPIGLDLGLAYSTGDNGAGNGSQNQILVGAGYTLNDLYLGATFSTGDLDDKAKQEFTAYEFAVQYKISKPFSVAAMYTFAEEDDNGTKSDATKGLELVGYYKLNSNFRTYLSYYLNKLDDVKDANGKVTSGEDTLRLGVRYDF